MTPRTFYAYLCRARRDLWAVLGTLPDAVLSERTMRGKRFGCLKDLVIHIPTVEDVWIREDILGVPLVQETFSDREIFVQEHVYDQPLERLLEYWRAVEADTESRWPELSEALTRRIPSHPSRPGDLISAEDALWHVLQHEVRHTAQIALLIRQAGYAPPPLDLIHYAPR